KSIAPTYLDSIRKLAGDGTSIIGLTATPGRSSSDDEENLELSTFFNNSKITFSPNGMNPIEYLRSIKVLASVEFLEVSGGEIEIIPEEITRIRNHDYSSDILKRLSDDSTRNVHIIKELLKQCSVGSQIIYFAPSVEQSQFVSSSLAFKGIKSFHIDSSTSKETRKSQVEAFKKSEIQVLCNYGVLSTGFDAPKTDVVFIARPTTSIVLYSQMIGRGLRGEAVGGKSHCKIIQVKDNFKN